MWGLDEGPNAKNTVSIIFNYIGTILILLEQVTALKKICENEIIPEDYPPFGYNCIGKTEQNESYV